MYIYCISYPYILATGMDMNLDMLGGRDGHWPAAGCLFVFKIGVVGVGAVPLLLGGVFHLPHHLQQRMHAYVEEEGFIIQKISQSSSLLSGGQY